MWIWSPKGTPTKWMRSPRGNEKRLNTSTKMIMKKDKKNYHRKYIIKRVHADVGLKKRELMKMISNNNLIKKKSIKQTIYP